MKSDNTLKHQILNTSHGNPLIDAGQIVVQAYRRLVTARGMIAEVLELRLQREIEGPSVDARDGVVTLSGCVGSLGEKRAARIAASQVPDVREVVDRPGVE
jgi:hypothetical protein